MAATTDKLEQLKAQTKELTDAELDLATGGAELDEVKGMQQPEGTDVIRFETPITNDIEQCIRNYQAYLNM